MSRANADIRTQARKAGVYLYEIADHLGVHETTLIRWLRTELTDRQREDIISAITSIEAKKTDL